LPQSTTPPHKPFDTFKWRWLSVAPTEGLLRAPVLLGVLRVLRRHEGGSKASDVIRNELETVQQATGSTVELAREGERNLLRNSGQYWTGMGLLKQTSGDIQLTQFGRTVADGLVTPGEFAATVIQQTVLPNPWTYSGAEISKWEAAGLRIRPFLVILQTLDGLNVGASQEAFLTARELVEIVIPLSGAKSPIPAVVDAIRAHRRGELDISNWPDCAPAANDRRLAREFLLFLASFSVLNRVSGPSVLDDRFFLDLDLDPGMLSAPNTVSLFGDEREQQQSLDAARKTGLASLMERQRILISVMSRPNQAIFRDSVLTAFNGRCFLSDEAVADVLEAAHIVPVAERGSDSVDNGLCLRVDIHRLYDAGHIRLKLSGEVVLSDAIASSGYPKLLPKSVKYPDFLNVANVHWRDSYL
jgi:hypothetical protein